MLKDRSSRPHSSPKVSQAEVIERILWLRKHYHFGPAKIAMYLARYHDVTISTSGVWRILKRLGMNRLPASAPYERRALRWKRYEKQRPGHQLQEARKTTHEPVMAAELRLGQTRDEERWNTYVETTRSPTDEFGSNLYRPGDRVIVEQVARIASERQVPRAQVALAWVASRTDLTDYGQGQR